MEQQGLKTTIVAILTFIVTVGSIAVEFLNTGAISGTSMSLVVAQILAIVTLFKTKDAASKFVA